MSRSLARSDVRLQEGSFLYRPDPGPSLTRGAWQGSTTAEPAPRAPLAGESRGAPAGPSAIAAGRAPAGATATAEPATSAPAAGGTSGDPREAPPRGWPEARTASAPIPTGNGFTTGFPLPLARLSPAADSVPTTVIAISAPEASLGFQDAEARSQSDTARKLGLSEQPLRSLEQIQALLQRIQQSIRQSPP